MNAPKFTPGPWRVDGSVSVVAESGLVALVYGPRPEGSGIDHNATHTANLCLIAVLPELYEAIDIAVGHLASIGYPKNAQGNYDKDGDWTFAGAVPRSVDAREVLSAFHVLRAALAKAVA